MGVERADGQGKIGAAAKELVAGQRIKQVVRPNEQGTGLYSCADPKIAMPVHLYRHEKA